MTKRYWTTAAAFGFAVALTSAAGADAIKLTLAGMAVPGETPPLAAEMFAKRLTEELGEVVNIAYNDSLLTGPELAPSVRDGRVEMAVAGAAYLTAAEPRFGITNLPGIVQNAEEYRKLMTEFLDAETAKLWEAEANAVQLVNGYWSPILIFSTSPLRTVEDFKGKKIRVSNVETGQFITQLGASPVAIAPSEIGMGLERGVIDGFITAICYSERQGFFEFTKYMDDWGISPVVGWTIVINKDVWDGLDPAVQDTMKRIGKEVEREVWSATDDLTDSCYAKAKDVGVELVVATEEERAKAYDQAYTEPVFDDWYKRAQAKGFDGPAFVDKARSVLGKN